MEKTIKNDNAIMQILKVNTINRVICHTDKGVLTLQIRKGENKYQLVLDAVPVPEDINKESMAILFPVTQQLVPQVNKNIVKEVAKKVIKKK